jgi:hypothetical protein
VEADCRDPTNVGFGFFFRQIDPLPKLAACPLCSNRGKHLRGPITRLHFMHNTRADVPRLPDVDWLARLTTLQHRKIAFE